MRRVSTGGGLGRRTSSHSSNLPPIAPRRPSSPNTTASSARRRRSTSADRSDMASTTLSSSHPAKVVLKFASSEIDMYAAWFRVDAALVRSIVTECDGDRELILASLHEHNAPGSSGALLAHSPSHSSPNHNNSFRRRSNAAQPQTTHADLAITPDTNNIEGSVDPVSMVSGGARRRSNSSHSAQSENAQQSPYMTSSPYQQPHRPSSVSLEGPQDPATLPPLARLSSIQCRSGSITSLVPNPDDQNGDLRSPPVVELFRFDQICTSVDHVEQPPLQAQQLNAITSSTFNEDGTTSVEATANTREHRLSHPIIKSELTARRWIMEEERVDVLRMWRVSKVSHRQFASHVANVMGSKESIARVGHYEAERDAWRCLMEMEAFDSIAMASRARVMENAGHELLVIAMLEHDACEAQHRRSLRRQESRMWDTQLVAPCQCEADRIQLMAREQSSRWTLQDDFALALRRWRARHKQLQQHVTEALAAQRYVTQFETAHRIAFTQLEEGHRTLLHQISRHMTRQAVAYIVEPWQRRMLSEEELRARDELCEQMRWSATNLVPLWVAEKQARLHEVGAEDEARTMVQLLVQYRRLKAVNHEHSPSVLRDPVVMSLLNDEETSRRHRLHGQWISLFRFLETFSM